ncbi:MAG: SusC/RagA family TonB-linked outer membrane protein, partial [Bacteroidaceae bacterium]|nr:SusC/RagA family TonB-linked outer membrane protein [Bacteroidaceae bacterium]
ATIKVSYIGYKPQEVKAAPSLVVTLEEDAHVLEEAVVIGYGVVKKADATGSVTAIEPDAMNKGLVTNTQDMSAGKIAGVNVVSDGGTPGGGASITIRGGSSLSASNAPLIVVDGLALDNQGIQGVANPLSTINPNDIESFTVLKDASATAIYGSRAANGVIIITTKKGAKGSKPRITYSGNVSVSTPVRLREVMTGDEFRALAHDIYGERENADEILGLLGDANTDWQKEVYRNALSHDQNLTVAGGLSWMPYRVSVGYTNQNGIVKTSNFERFTASVNLAPTFFDDYLKFNINAKGMYVENRYAADGAIGAAAAFDPTQPVYGDPNQFGGYWQWTTGTGGYNSQAPLNPLAILEQKDDRAYSWDFIGNIEADYRLHFFPDMRVHANIGIDMADGNQYTNLPREAAGTFGLGSVSSVHKYKTNKMLNAYLQYTKEFGANNIDVMAGYEWQHFYNEGESAWDNLDNTNAGTDKWKMENYLVSFFGRLNYQLFNRYLLTATVRYDGTSRFSADNRWGLFPSVALAWKIKEESFLQDVSWLSDLKLRLGWGITGQQEIGGYYDYIPVYSQSKDHAFYPIGTDANGNFIYLPYARPDAYNPDLKWEETTTYNAGLDFGFLNGRIRGAVDYYLRDTKDLLNMTSVSAGTNFGPAVTSNVGSLRNQGVEFSIEATAIQTKDWTWELGYNVAYNQNEITKLTNGVGDDYYVPAGNASAGTGSPIKVHKVGYPAGSFYVYEQVYDTNGKPIQGCFVDRNADGQITAADKYVYENPAADFNMGFTSKLMWKNWDFSFSLRASIGNYVYNDN